MIVERSSAPRGLKVSARFVGHTAMAVSHECNSPSAVSTKVVICCRTNRCIKTSPSDSAKRIVRLYATVSQAHVADPVPHILSLYGEERVGEKREAKKKTLKKVRCRISCHRQRKTLRVTRVFDLLVIISSHRINVIVWALATTDAPLDTARGQHRISWLKRILFY